MKETDLIIALAGMLFLALVVVSIMLYNTLRNQARWRQRLEKQEAEHTYSNKLMQIRLGVQEHTLNNMSAEMMENIAQVMVAVRMKTHLLYTHATDAGQRAIAEEASLITRELVKDVRNMSYAMKDIYLLRNGLKDSVEKELGRIVAAQRIKCNFTQTGTEQHLDADRELILFSIIQQGMADAVTYGHALALSVSLQYLPGRLHALIEHSGIGGSEAGTANIEERTKLLGGSVDISSETGKGTRILINIPL
ncbi:MAG TPA: hypothetical protein VIN07_03075 [Flavipsychrobacter sp.]